MKKLQKKASKGTLTMANPGGVVGEAMREISKTKNLARLANKNPTKG